MNCSSCLCPRIWLQQQQHHKDAHLACKRIMNRIIIHLDHAQSYKSPIYHNMFSPRECNQFQKLPGISPHGRAEGRLTRLDWVSMTIWLQNGRSTLENLSLMAGEVKSLQMSSYILSLDCQTEKTSNSMIGRVRIYRQTR